MTSTKSSIEGSRPPNPEPTAKEQGVRMTLSMLAGDMRARLVAALAVVAGIGYARNFDDVNSSVHDALFLGQPKEAPEPADVPAALHTLGLSVETIVQPEGVAQGRAIALVVQDPCKMTAQELKLLERVLQSLQLDEVFIVTGRQPALDEPRLEQLQSKVQTVGYERQIKEETEAGYHESTGPESANLLRDGEEELTFLRRDMQDRYGPDTAKFAERFVTRETSLSGLRDALGPSIKNHMISREVSKKMNLPPTRLGNPFSVVVARGDDVPAVATALQGKDGAFGPYKIAVDRATSLSTKRIASNTGAKRSTILTVGHENDGTNSEIERASAER